MQQSHLEARRGRAFWSKQIAEFESAPCPHSEFAARHGLKLGAFRSWLYQLRSEGLSAIPSDPGPGFVEVVEAPPKKRSVGGCSLIVGNVELHFEKAPSPAYLASLLVKVNR